MENLKDIISNNKDLYENLKKYDCKVSYNGKLLYEGKFKDDLNFEKRNKSQLVYEFNINNQNIIILGENNTSEDKLKEMFENNKFSDLKTNSKLYNEAMTLANSLPLYNLDIPENLRSDINKHGINYRKIYENLMINDIDSELSISESDYDIIIEKLLKAKESGTPIDEGILGAIGGAIIGAAWGPKLGNAICKALGVDPKGSFGSLLTSRLVMAAIGTTMGWKL